ncbi:MAG: hypothetical protein PHD48_00080 [Alphaproteobacteria bacterium]|nr:hypothetical protein [Alphaproteobacteria bacterium]
MKAIIMAFGKEGSDVCGCVRDVLNGKKATLVCSGQENVGGRACFAAVADFGSEATNLKSLQEGLKAEGESQGLEIKVLRPCLFLAMHRVVPTALEPIT